MNYLKHPIGFIETSLRAGLEECRNQQSTNSLLLHEFLKPCVQYLLAVVDLLFCRDACIYVKPQSSTKQITISAKLSITITLKLTVRKRITKNTITKNTSKFL